MMKIAMVVMAFVMMLVSGTAYALHCPADMKKIDAALEKGVALTAEDVLKVRELRADGERLHLAGKHQESVDVLAKAMHMLSIH